MNRVLTILAAVLIAQLLLIAILLFGAPTPATPNAGNWLPPLATADRLAVADSTTEVILSRDTEGWRLPSGLPADSDKVEGLLQQLGALQAEWPVAVSPASHLRFEVAANAFQRRVRVDAGDSRLAEFLVGTSPGFRKAHARRVEDDAVYALALNTFELPVTENDWLDKLLLAVAEPEVIAGPDYRLTRNGEDWNLANEDDSQPVDATGLVEALRQLRVTGIASGQEFTAPAATLVVSDGSQEFEYRFYQQDDRRYVRRSDIDATFELTGFEYERLAGLRREDLTATAAAGPLPAAVEPDPAAAWPPK